MNHHADSIAFELAGMELGGHFRIQHHVASIVRPRYSDAKLVSLDEQLFVECGEPCLERGLVDWSGALAEFSRLRDAQDNPKRIIAYVRRHGPLGFCRHRRLAINWRRQDPAKCLDALECGETFPWRTVRDCTDCDDEYTSGSTTFLEPVSAWLFHSRQLHAILSLAASLLQGERTHEEEWKRLRIGDADAEWEQLRAGAPDKFWQALVESFEGARGTSIVPDSNPERQWRELSAYVTQWLQLARTVGLHVVPAEPPGVGLRTRMEPDDHCGVLAMQLAAAVCSEVGVYRCDRCDNPYQPAGRAPRGDRRALCPTCRDDPATKAELERRRYRERRPTPQRSSKYRDKATSLEGGGS